MQVPLCPRFSWMLDKRLEQLSWLKHRHWGTADLALTLHVRVHKFLLMFKVRYILTARSLKNASFVPRYPPCLFLASVGLYCIRGRITSLCGKSSISCLDFPTRQMCTARIPALLVLWGCCDHGLILWLESALQWWCIPWWPLFPNVLSRAQHTLGTQYWHLCVQWSLEE